MIWQKKSDTVAQTYAEFEQVLLQNRNIFSKDSQAFFNPSSPLELQASQVGIEKKTLILAAAIILQAILDNKKIVIFGDYDADGICASAVLWESLYAIFVATHAQSKNFPVPFIPDREKHGYGISIVAVDEIIQIHNPDLIITVDNGIVAHEAAQYVQERGIQLIITDHHEPEYKTETELLLPQADCVVHSTQLCGASVAWMLVKEIEHKYQKKQNSFTMTHETSLDLVGIATIADQVPLFEANRSFATYGLVALKKTKRVGLQKLFNYCQITQNDITEWSVGFGIAPRINAMGRLEHGIDALRLLCSKKPIQAEKYAQLLNTTNQKRQDLTKNMVADAKTQVLEKLEENIIIVYSSEYHEGILGLIAGGLTETYSKPAIAISLAGEFAKASARSIPGVNIVKILREIKNELIAVGGHPMAAGFSFETQKLEQITQSLYDIAKKEINPEDLQRSLRVDCEVAHTLLTLETTEKLQKFGPFGMGNPQPQIQVSEIEVLEIKTIGKDNSHVKFTLGSDSIEKINAIGWKMAHTVTTIKVGELITVVGGLDINEWNNTKSVQFTLKDIQSVTVSE